MNNEELELVMLKRANNISSQKTFAKEIMHISKSTCQVNPIETVEYLALNADTPVPKGKVGCPTPAKRPNYSLLNKSKIKKEFNITIPYWKDSLDECLKNMGERS